MNQYLTDYDKIIDRILAIDDTNPGMFYLVYRLLTDLRDEINDLRISSTDALIDGVLQIAVEKINRRIDYLNRMYTAQFIESEELEKEYT